MEPTIVLLTILIASIYLYYFVKNDLYYFKRLKIPHVIPIPILGNMTPILFRRTTYMEHIQKLYNLFSEAKYFVFYDFTRPIFIIRDPSLISTIAVKEFDNFCDHRSFVDETLDPIAGKNLFDMRGDQWREMRKLLTPSFTSSKMKMMFGLVNECAENCINFVAKQSGKTGKTYDMKDILSRYATDIVATCSFGISVDSFNHPNNEFFLLGQKTVNFDYWVTFLILMNRSFPLLTKLFNFKMFGPRAETFFKNILCDQVKMRDEQGIYRPDMIQLMMESRNKDSGPVFDINDMTAQTLFFFLAGFDTISNAMSLMSYELGINPDIQSKLREEIDDVYRQTNGKPTYEAIKRMKYLDAVVHETLRLFPIITHLDRICVKETELPPATSGGKPIKIKPGNCIWFPVFSLHRDPKYYSQPDKFDPERFLNGHVDNSVYMPFGIGPRMCIGNRFALMEAKVMLFHLLSRCNLEPDVKTKIPMPLGKKSFIISESGFWLKVRTRNLKTSVTDLSNGHVEVEGQDA